MMNELPNKRVMKICLSSLPLAPPCYLTFPGPRSPSPPVTEPHCCILHEFLSETMRHNRKTKIGVDREERGR